MKKTWQVNTSTESGNGESKPKFVNPFPFPTVDERVEMAMEDGDDTLYICPNAWALRHRFIEKQSGEMIRARCNSWRCLYCGPRKVDQWRQLIAAGEPVLHIVLSRAGKTIEEAARALTTFVQYLRRGSKGRGRGHVGARPAYSIEYFAVLERHLKFDETGFHWHLLVKGVDFIAKEHLDAAWHSATHGLNDWAYINRVKNGRTIGYVTKYLTKDIIRQEKGVKLVEREMVYLDLDAAGEPVLRRETRQVEVVSKARRIRYSRGFFPESVELLRARLFAQEEGEVQIDSSGASCAPGEEAEKDVNTQKQEPSTGSGWILEAVMPATKDKKEYWRRRRQGVREAIEQRMSTGKRHSRRVLTIWNYQREQLRLAG